MDKPDGWFLAMFGRLKPGWTMERASTHLASLSAALFQETLPTRYSQEDAKNYLAFKLGSFPAGIGVSTLRPASASPWATRSAACSSARSRAPP